MRHSRIHLRLVVGILTVLIIVGFTDFESKPESVERAATNTAPQQTTPQLQATMDALTGPQSTVGATRDNKVAPTSTIQSVGSGDSLERIFRRAGFSPRQLAAITSTRLGKQLREIFPGQTMTFTSNGDQLNEFSFHKNRLESLHFTFKDDGSVVGETRTAHAHKAQVFQHGIIQESLFLTSQALNIPDGITMRLAQIFQWDIDFVLDIRPGDEFFVLYEELFLDGERIGFGDILAADFINRGKLVSSVLFTDKTGVKDYFDLEGVSMRKAFLRAPVEFSRVSSSFNLRRKHPLYNTVRPHRGIDYAAPTGTPILAAGDGKVTTASRNAPNGRYVVIKHGEQFVTKYLHLSKFARGVRKGKRVKQGQVIGYVGATGWATGPHLHYEFLVNGVHKNPRTVPLPQASPVAKQELAYFKNQAKRHRLLFEALKKHPPVAMGQ